MRLCVHDTLARNTSICGSQTAVLHAHTPTPCIRAHSRSHTQALPLNMFPFFRPQCRAWKKKCRPNRPTLSLVIRCKRALPIDEQDDEKDEQLFNRKSAKTDPIIHCCSYTYCSGGDDGDGLRRYKHYSLRFEHLHIKRGEQTRPANAQAEAESIERRNRSHFASCYRLCCHYTMHSEQRLRSGGP